MKCNNLTIIMRKFIIGAILGVIGMAGANAADFFSTQKCDNLFTIGVRAGLNTSNRTTSNRPYRGAYHQENWGTGFNLGAVVNLNIRDYLAIQPGFFFDGRSGSYLLTDKGSYTVPNPETGAEDVVKWGYSQSGQLHTYDFTIPVMAVFRFNITDRLRWNVEAGPYLSFVLASYLTHKRNLAYGTDDSLRFPRKAATVDFGLKFGTSLTLMKHYSIGVHYLAGMVPAWKSQDFDSYTKTYGGFTKSWMFTLGYDF